MIRQQGVALALAGIALLCFGISALERGTLHYRNWWGALFSRLLRYLPKSWRYWQQGRSGGEVNRLAFSILVTKQGFI